MACVQNKTFAEGSLGQSNTIKSSKLHLGKGGRSFSRIAGLDPCNLHGLQYHIFPGLDPYYADPAPPLTTVGEELDHLDHDLSDLPVGGVKYCRGWVFFSRVSMVWDTWVPNLLVLVMLGCV